MGRRAVHVSGEMWQRMCTQGWESGVSFRCVEGLPEGAEFERAYYRRTGGRMIPDLYFVFSHPDWDNERANGPWSEPKLIGVVFQSPLPAKND